MDTIDHVIREAGILKSQGRLDDAESLLTGTLRTNPDAHAVSFQLALLFVDRGNWSSAERIARSAAPLAGDSFATGFGQILANVGAFDEAENCFRRALAVNARDATTLACLGAVHIHKRKLAEGLACIEAALAIQPNFREAQMNRSAALHLLDSSRQSRATLEEYARQKGVDTRAIDSMEVEFPSAFVDANGNPRFTLSLPGSIIINDLGAAVLFREEVIARGWEFPVRKFLEEELRTDDVFVDVGAHWGIHSLTAATTRWSNQVSVLAIEAHPKNVERLRSWVARNGVQDTVEIVSAALGDADATARLRIDGSSMGHSLRSTGKLGSPTLEVGVTTLDRLIAERMRLQWRRMIVKIDVEGNEYEVLLGARRLLASGNIAAIIWENGAFYEPKELFERRKAILDLFNSYGFAHYRFDHTIEQLAPLSTLDEACDVYSLRHGARAG